MLKPKYFETTKSISWLLMPWLLASPEHRQLWYWLYMINMSSSSIIKDFNYLHQLMCWKMTENANMPHISVDEFSMTRVNQIICSCKDDIFFLFRSTPGVRLTVHPHAPSMYQGAHYAGSTQLQPTPIHVQRVKKFYLSRQNHCHHYD